MTSTNTKERTYQSSQCIVYGTKLDSLEWLFSSFNGHSIVLVQLCYKNLSNSFKFLSSGILLQDSKVPIIVNSTLNTKTTHRSYIILQQEPQLGSWAKYPQMYRALHTLLDSEINAITNIMFQSHGLKTWCLGHTIVISVMALAEI